MKFAEASINELENVLDTLFDSAPRIPARDGVDIGHDPVIGQMFIEGQDRSVHRLMVCRALVAGAKFRQEAPGWPHLPTRPEDIEEMVEADCVRCNVVGHFGNSLSLDGWTLQHPGFAPFVGGLLFDKHTPEEIRNNPELLEEFPPVKLAGMIAGSLIWRSPEALALNQKMRRMYAVHAGGL